MALTVKFRMLLGLLTILVLLGGPAAVLAGAVPVANPEPGTLLASAGLLAFLAGLTAYAYHRPAAAPRQHVALQHTLTQGLELARSALIEPARDARTAIIRCYAALESALNAIPALAPQPADSPSEVLSRAHRAGALRSPTSWRLVELFDEARFSGHPMTEPDRATAENSLREILDELRGRR